MVSTMGFFVRFWSMRRNGTVNALKRPDLDCVMALIRPWLWIQKQRMSIFQAY